VTAPSLLLLAAALVVAALNLYTVIASRPQIQAVTKPAVMVLLILAAATLHPHTETQRWLFVVGLALGLSGDVLLLPQVNRFIPAVVAFAVGHIAYIAGFWVAGLSAGWAGAGLVVVIVGGAILLPPMVRGLRSSGRNNLLIPAIAYAVVISAFMVSAAASGRSVAAAGALLFYASDGLLGWTNFVGPLRWGGPVNIVLYHLGQTLLVVSLAV
jgi:uncharacterized membrane protein YhhN